MGRGSRSRPTVSVGEFYGEDTERLGYTNMSIVSMIDHAVLQPAQTDEDLRAACQLCAELQVASVCVKPSMVPLASQLLIDSGVAPSTVIGFPHGGTTTECKVREAEIACRQGARKVDLVVNLGRVLATDWAYVSDDIQAVVQAAQSAGAITKVILRPACFRTTL